MILSNEFSVDAPYGQNMCVITCKLGQKNSIISVTVTVRDLLLRDNLFEIITSFRTFYIQVKTHLSFRNVVTVSLPLFFQVYPSTVVVSIRSAAEVLQRTAL